MTSLSTWLTGEEKFDISSYLSERMTSSTTLTTTYRGLALSYDLKEGQLVKLTDLGYSYSYDRDVAESFALTELQRSNMSKVYVLVVDEMRCYDLTRLTDYEESSLLDELKLDHFDSIASEQEVICCDTSTYRIEKIDYDCNRLNKVNYVYLKRET